MALMKPLPAEESKPDFCVIGIGASAGGLDALRTFFSRMPAAPGFACVVVVHLSPEHESHLVQMLQPYTQMPVCQVVRTTALERNRVYVIPPNANLNSIDTHLRLTELESRRSKRAPIDHFLRTLAQTHGETAIGVILSGAGSDGALGIRQIRERGGLTVVQKPQEAEYGSMPQAAIDTGAVDVVLAVRDMPEEIAGYCVTQPVLKKPDPDDNLPADESSLLEKILAELRPHTGHDFAMYRRETVLRRLRRRMRLRRVNALSAYLEVLRNNTEEPQALYNDLLLNVTEFFRDPDVYETIAGVLGEVLEKKRDRDARVRVWSIGCSTGEEAYSLAMLLIERSGGGDDQPPLQVFASELSSQALQQAREGVYPQEIGASISSERLERFFVHENGRYRVRRDLRDMVTFATHDLFKDPPYSHLDLIVCRHLLSDLRPNIRQSVLSLFYYALEPNGALLVGPDDDVDSDLFVRDANAPRLLRRAGGPRRILQLPSGIKSFASLGSERPSSPAWREGADIPAMFRMAIDGYVPPSVMIDARNCVVHFSATAARYLRIPGGVLTLDILRLVPEAIGYRLKQGLEEARRTRRPWRSEPFVIFAEKEAQPRRMMIRVDWIPARKSLSEMLLVVFDDTVALPEAKESAGGLESAQRTRTLQQELVAMQQRLEVLSTTVRTGAAESQAVEEQREDDRRSTLEELDEARAELQAANEELLSINHENQYRIDTLAQLSNDMQHMLESAGLAALLVDRALSVVRYTPLAEALLRLRTGDIGRPLADLNHLLQWDTLLSDVQCVLNDVTELEREVQSIDGRWFLVRVHPYRTALRGVEGAAIMFTDISERKRAELTLQEADRRKEEFLAVLAHELRNPLAPITAGLELLKRLPSDAALQERVVATMARQSRQLVRLVDDLLEVGRINEGKVALQMQPVSIAEVTRDALATVRPLTENLQQELTVDVPDDEPLYVEGDAVRLTQVIGNLLHNSSRYTPSRGKIIVRARRDGDQVEISVQDNGRGMSPDALRNAFEMFYQGGESQMSGAGLGIGLTLARKLVEMHCGSIAAASAGARLGSTFTVRLPLTHRRPAQPREANAPAPQARDQHRVLIVDDNEDAAQTLRELMEALGAGEVRTASNGHDALEAAAQMHPDIIMLDLSMPGMDGYELARRMRAESWGKQTLLIALTGWGQEQHRRRSKEAGFDRHLTKPVDPAALRAVLGSSSPSPGAGAKEYTG